MVEESGVEAMAEAMHVRKKKKKKKKKRRE